MELQTLNKIDFKKYLLDKLHDSRQEDFIFWKNEIPLPIDLVYKIFDERGELFKLYIDHIASVYLYTYKLKQEGSEWVNESNSLPTSELKKYTFDLVDLYSKYFITSKTSELTRDIADKLFVSEYDFTAENFTEAICHEGRKYKRLYIPAKIKHTIEKYDTYLLRSVGISNGDMFGNVVADGLNVYRSGFSDAFATIFNKLLDFVLEKSNDKQISYSTASKIKIAQETEDEISYTNFNSGKINDGSLWEPRYINARTSYMINSKHPYFEFIGKKSGTDVLIDLLSQSAMIENEILRDNDRKIIENYRQELSRRLRLIAEKI
jgi:hypothetical protein